MSIGILLDIAIHLFYHQMIKKLTKFIGALYEKLYRKNILDTFFNFYFIMKLCVLCYQHKSKTINQAEKYLQS